MSENVTSEVVIRCKLCGAIKPDDYGESERWHYAGFNILFDGGEFEYKHNCQKWYIVFEKPAPPMVGASHYAGVIESGE